MTEAFLFALILSQAHGAPTPAGIIQKVAGYKIIHIESQSGVRDVEVNAPVFESDKITTTMDQSVKLQFEDQSEIVVGPSSSMVLAEFKSGKPHASKIALAYGMLRSWVQKRESGDESFVIKTGSSASGVRGTTFVVETNRATGESILHTEQGRVVFANSVEALADEQRAVVVGAGQASSIRAGASSPSAPRGYDATAFQRDLQNRAPQFQSLSQASGATSQKTPSDKSYDPQDLLKFPNGLEKKKK